MAIIPTLLYLTLRSASVQTYLAGKATDYLSRELDANISVGGVDVSLFLNVVLEDVEMLDKNQQPLLKTRRIILDVGQISTSTRFLLVNKILFEQASVAFSKYEGEDAFNFQFLLDYFNKKETTDTTNLPKWDVIVRSFEFDEASLSFINHNKEHSNQGFDSNNFSFTKLNIAVNDIFLEKDTLRAQLENFSVKESKGFELNSAVADIFFSPIGSYIHNFSATSGESRLSLDLDLDYQGYEAFDNFMEDISFNLDIKPSFLELYELGYFSSPLYGIEGIVDIRGNLSGEVNNLRGKNILLQYGGLTEFMGSFNLVGLPNIEETFANLSIDHFKTHKAALESFRLPNNMDSEHLLLPTETEKFGIVSFNGNFTGFLHDFVAYGQFKTDLGNVDTDLAILSSYDFKEIKYSGNIASEGFDLGLFLGNSQDFGGVSLATHIEGTGYNNNNLDVRITGEIQSIDFLDYDYQQIQLSGNFTNSRFNGKILIDDPNIFLDFGGVVDFSDEMPLLNFTAQIDNANLTALNFYQRDTLYHSIFSTLIHVDGSGSNLSNMEGEINAYSSTYSEKPIFESDTIDLHSISTDVIALENHILENNHKNLRFYSDFVDLQIEGELHFEEVANSIRNFLYTYAPSAFRQPPANHEQEKLTQNAEFKLHIKNINDITNVFMPALQIAPHSFFNGHINTHTNELSFTGSTDYLLLGGNRLNNPEFSISSDLLHMEIIARGEKLFITDSIWMEQFFTSGTLAHDTINLLTQWENKGSPQKNLGSLKAKGMFLSPTATELSIVSSYAYLNDSLWTFKPDNKILIDSSSVNITNFFLHKNEEFLQINGSLSANPEDVLTIQLNHFDLGSLAFLLGERKVEFAGIASGALKLSNLAEAPNISTELLIKDFEFNKDHLGDLSLQSRWDALEQAFRINAEVIYYGNVGTNKPIVAKGFFYPEKEDDNFDLDIVIENLKMSVFGRYMKAFASNFRGLASGQLRLEGPSAKPELSGTARLVRTGFRVDYLNTVYSFAHDLEVGKDYMKFDNLTINDTIGNSAKASGILRHNNFREFNIDVTLMPENLVVLNTQPHHNELFYGSAFATGLVHVHGPVENISIDISATANRGTQFFLPLDYYGEVTETNFISFVSPIQGQNQEQTPQLPQKFGLSLNFDLAVTPEAEIQIIFDSKIGDILRGRGFGDLKVEIDNQGLFSMYGDYTIQDGDYLFTLQNLINKRFHIEQGGTIRWTGDPYDADIDIKALYRLRTSLFDLAANQSDTSDVYKRRVPVETVLHLTDKLFNPSLSFDIQLPGTDESTREMIDRIITTEQEMNRQVFSLLILNRFVPPEGGFNTALSYGMGSTSSELLSNQLSNWLSQISSDFDIGINYRPGDEISSQEIEVALTTQLFDDRVVIDGNFGVAGDHPAQNQRTSNIIGDVNVEVKITPEGKFRVKAFNRSNTFDVLNTSAPYTQGVGVFYRKEFDSLSDLFKKQKRTVLEIPEFEDAESMERD